MEDIGLHNTRLTKDLITSTTALAEDAKISADLALTEIDSVNQSLTDKEPSVTVGNSAEYYAGDKTWKSFATSVKNTVLDGLSTAVKSVVTVTDNVIEAIGKLQAQIEAKVVTGTTNQVTVIDDTTGGFEVSLADNIVFPGKHGITLPIGTTAERNPSPTTPEVRFNDDLDVVEIFSRGQWRNVLDSTLIEDNSDYTGFPNRTDTAISFDTATRTFSLTALNGTFDIYHSGKRTILSTIQFQIPNTSGQHFLQITPDGTFVDASGPTFTNVLVASLNWNADQQKLVLFGDERHGISMSPTLHSYLHTTRGTQYRNGLIAGNYTLTGDGTSNNDCKISISDGRMWDEDLAIIIANNAPQQLNPFAKMPIWYRAGGAAGIWYRDDASDYPVSIGVNRLNYNTLVSGNWNKVEATEDSSFVAMWIVATNDMTEPMVSVMGQFVSETLEDALVANTIATFQWGTQPVAEYKILYRCIFETNSTFTNDSKAALRSITDVRAVEVVSAAVSTTATHSSLSGLNDDDHSQYLHLYNPRVITALHEFAPHTSNPPFELGNNAVGQLVTGLNADFLDGKHASEFGLVTDIANKADKGTTLSEYNIGDAYTKTETDNRIQAVVGAAPVALDTLVEIANQLASDESAVSALTVTVSQKANTADVNLALAAKADTTAVNSALSGKENTISSGTTAQYYRGDKTWRSFATDVLNALLAGISTATSTAVISTDSIVIGIGKLQAQINTLTTSVSNKEGTITVGTTTQYYRGDKTWREFSTDVLASVLTGLSTASITVISATDSVLTAIGKLQAQINNLSSNSLIPGISVLQTFKTNIAAISGTTSKTDSVNVPTISNGTEIWSQNVTLNDIANEISINGSVHVDHNSTNRRIVLAAFRDTTCIGVAAGTVSSSGRGEQVPFDFNDFPNTTSEITYSIRCFANNSGTWYINQTSAGYFGDRLSKSTIELKEIVG